MSGFIGVFNTDCAPVDSELLNRLTDSLTFRGLACGSMRALLGARGALGRAGSPLPGVSQLKRAARTE
jgi:hypothetical protein